MAIRIVAARIFTAMSFATLALIPMAAVAGSCGRGFCYGNFVDGMVSSSSYYVSNVPPLQVREFPPDPPRVVTCRRSEEVVTVPIEGGGEQQVRITRC
jgi:hypothetical protein